MISLIALYAAESWTLTKTSRQMWIWKRMKKISGMDKIYNEEVSAQVNKMRTILNTIWSRKHR